MGPLETIRAALRANLDARASHEASIDTLIAAAETRGSDFDESERAAFAEARTAIAALDGGRPELEAREADFVARNTARAAAEERARALPTSAVVAVGGGTVRNEARTYRQNGEHSFLCDLYAVHHRTGDYVGAEQRQQRHLHEETVERRDINVSALAGAIPPQFLVDQFAMVARAGRPFLNSLNAMPLPPEGIDFTIPRGTTGTVGAMTAEAAAFNETDPANTDMTNSVRLVSASTDISRTMFMRGGSVVDQILFPDLIAASEVALNANAWSGNGTAPNHRGVLAVVGIEAVTYTDATPTVSELWPKLSDAVQRINSLRFLPGNVIYMHPRRWGMVTSATDTTGRPLFEFSSVPPNSVFGLGVAAQYGQVVGTLQGLPVITDATLPTNLGVGVNEDIIVVLRSFDILYWEDDVMQFTFEQTLPNSPGQVRLAVGRFSLLAAGRYPKAIATIGGTGFTPPAF